MVNYAGGFNQSETGKYFKLITMFIIQSPPHPDFGCLSFKISLPLAPREGLILPIGSDLQETGRSTLIR